MDFLIGLLLLVLILAVVGFLTYLITTNIPMDDTFKQVIRFAVVILVVIYILGVLVGRIPLPTFPFLGAR